MSKKKKKTANKMPRRTAGNRSLDAAPSTTGDARDTRIRELENENAALKSRLAPEAVDDAHEGLPDPNDPRHWGGRARD